MPATSISKDALASLPPLSCTALWRASEMASGRSTVCATGFPSLDRELPNAGWPRSTLTELLLQQSGIGEMQLLKPALVALSATQKIVLIQPPYVPQALACQSWGIAMSQLLWIKASTASDALWSTEQILKNGSCGAVILWQTHVRADALRRLNLAAQSTDTWLWVIRPIACVREASPSPLRMSLRPMRGGVSVDVVKRRGPQSEKAFFVPLADMPRSRLSIPVESDHAMLVQPSLSTAAARDATSVLV